MRTIVIGAGPAGLNAAMFASSENNRVILIEKNEKAGKKIFITGKGRCNVCNDCSEKEFIDHIVSNPRFLFSAVNYYSPKDTQEYFSRAGVPLIVERGNRVYPESGKAFDITDGLMLGCKKKGVAIHFNETVVSIARKDNLFVVHTTRNSYECENLVIATGGLAYPSTGSTGDGYAFAKRFGHEIIDCVPALTGIRIQEEINPELIGLTLRNVTLKVKDGKWKHEEFGELTMREGFLDGAIALTTSSLINRRDLTKVSMSLDLKPALSEEVLTARIQRDLAKLPKGNMRDLLEGLLPFAFIPFFLSITGIDPDIHLAEMKKETRLKLIASLKGLPLTIVGLNDFTRSIVTAGGISTKEINSSTMESKLIPGLYFAGEVIDVDGYTGGFNIQTALSTGALAGKSIAEKA